MIHRYLCVTVTHAGDIIKREETIEGVEVATRWGFEPGNRAAFLELINRWNATSLRASSDTNPPRHVYVALAS